MNWTDALPYLCLFFYAVAFVASVSGILGRSGALKKSACWLCGAGFTFHTVWLLVSICTSAFSNVSRGFYLLPFAWVIALAGFILARRISQELLLHFVSPWTFFICACALGFSKTPGTMILVQPLFILHLVAMFVGIGVMAVAAGAGILFILQERSLKKRSVPFGFHRNMPALDTLDKINSIATLVGFPCYLLGFLCGFLWARISWSTFFSGDIKEWISLFVLLLYAFLFHQRKALGWHGRKPAILAISIFAISLFSLFVVNTVLSAQHGF